MTSSLPGLLAWRSVASRVTLDPRFPIRIELVVNTYSTIPREVQICCVVKTKDATRTGPDNCGYCVHKSDPPVVCPHLDEEVELRFSRPFPLETSETKMKIHLMEMIHYVVLHELEEFLRIDGDLVWDPHKVDDIFHPRRIGGQIAWFRIPQGSSPPPGDDVFPHPEDERTD